MPIERGEISTDAQFKENLVAVIRASSQLTTADGVMIDISPKTIGNNTLGANDGSGYAANPLTGRVTVNRHWATFFGRGLVRTTEDFGYQGELPTHPELLDWLAVEFVGFGDLGFGDLVKANSKSRNPKSTNSTKRLHRLLVTSATYQQSSRVTPELLARDANNELLARGPRFRLEAELLRDSFLKISGLLSAKVGGPSVFPPQPANVTTEGTYGQLNWIVSTFRMVGHSLCSRRR